ncbi:MAG: galactokinase [Planctomycetota bacterium]
MSGSPAVPLAERVRGEFAKRHGGDSARVFFAPGRVNLIGAHLDYSGGDVLPLAVDRGIYVAARLRSDDRVRLCSLDQTLAVEVTLPEIGSHQQPGRGWANYPLGVLHVLAEHTGESVGADLVFGGDLPMASGLSSSAALEVATATALDALLGTRLDPLTLAQIAHRAENDYVGLQCGIMDQFASAMGRADHALLLHCHTQTFEHVPLDHRAFEVLVMDSRKPRRLAATGFNQRVRECQQAHAALRAAGIDRPCLAAYEPAELERVESVLDEVLLRRARHVVSEMQRVDSAVKALRRGDVAAFGACLTASHASTARNYDVSCDELDELTGAACACPGVFGARLTGAGFGGCAIALVVPGRTEDVAEAVAARYESRFAVTPGFEVLRAGSGPREL